MRASDPDASVQRRADTRPAFVDRSFSPGWPGCWSAPSIRPAWTSVAADPTTASARPRPDRDRRRRQRPGQLHRAGIAQAAADGSSAVIVTLTRPAAASTPPSGSCPRCSRRRCRPSSGSPRAAAEPPAPARSSRSRRTSRTWRPARTSGRRRRSGRGGEELTGTIGDKVKNDAIANIRSIAEARQSGRRLGGLDRRQGRLVDGDRGRRGRGGRWDRDVPRRCPSTGRWPHRRSPLGAGHGRARRCDRSPTWR